MKYPLDMSLCLIAAPYAAPGRPAPEPPPAESVSRAPAAAPAPSRNTLQVNDEVVITARDLEEMADRPHRMEPDGTITVPLAGKARAQAFTVEELTKELEAQAGVFVRLPQVPVMGVAAARTNSGSLHDRGRLSLADRTGILDVITAAEIARPRICW